MNQNEQFLQGYNQEQSLTVANIKEKLLEPEFLPAYNDLRKVIDSLTDEHCNFEDQDEYKKWKDFLDNKENPIFEIPTKEYIEKFSSYITTQAIKYGGTKDNPVTLLEVGAGTGKFGHLVSEALKKNSTENIKLVTTNLEGKGWTIKPQFGGVENLSYIDAVKKYKPTIVLVSWMPAGEDWTEDFRRIENIKEYILVGPEEVTGVEDRTWDSSVYAKEGFELVDHLDLSDVQISRTDIMVNPKKEHAQYDMLSKTISFVRKF